MGRCITCLKPTANPRFCSKRCSAVTNNHRFPKRQPTGKCKRCSSTIVKARRYCGICKPTLRIPDVKMADLAEVWSREGRRVALDLVGLALWWGEGHRTRGVVSVTNTDPEMLLLVLAWLCEVHRVPLPKVHVGLNLYDDLDVDQIVRFWSEYLGIPRSQFTKPFVYPRRDSKRKDRVPYGICRLVVYNTELASRLRSRLQQLKRLVQSKPGYRSANAFHANPKPRIGPVV